MEIVEDSPRSAIYEVVTTRMKEYIHPENSDQQSYYEPQRYEKENNNFIILGTLVAAGVLGTSVLSLAVFKLGTLYTILVCLIVVSMLMLGYTVLMKFGLLTN